MSWDQAKSYAKRLALGGHKDWRLPTMDELRGLYDGSLTSPCKGSACHTGEEFHVHEALQLGAASPWSSEIEDGIVNLLHLTLGNEGGVPPTSKRRVLAVRKIR